MADVIVVGARCAGASTALLLAQRGYEVLLLDSAPFPSDTMSTLYIQQPGVALLRDWGVLDGLIASGCPRLDSVTYTLGDIRLEGPAAVLEGVGGAYAPRRAVLDQLLVKAAVAAGTRFMDRSRVLSLDVANGIVNGVCFRDAAGTVRHEPARLVVGADGMRSAVAREVGATLRVAHPVASCAYYSVWEGLSAGLEYSEQPNRYAAVIPTHEGRTIVATYFPQAEFASIKRDALGAHTQAIAQLLPALAAAMPGAERVGRLQGTGDQQNFFRQAQGPGWVLVGDAGHHKDSITARGITDALLQAHWLATEVGDSLMEAPRLSAALSRFERIRDDELAEPYRNALAVAKLTVSPSRRSMMRAIGSSPTLTQLYFEVLAGVRSTDDLLVPELLDALSDG